MSAKTQKTLETFESLERETGLEPATSALARRRSTKWLESADFFRLENISLSYNLSKKITKFADIRLTLSCQNLFTVSGYKGMDPAGTTFSNNNVDVDAGIDMGAYPTPRTFTFGVRMNF